jgi:MFS superfamily sulfate permease-like transporter
MGADGLAPRGGHGQLAAGSLASASLLLVALFFTTVLTDMPKSVLGAIVFLIGVDLVDVQGLRRIACRRQSEFIIALVTAVVVCAIGVEQGIVLAMRATRRRSRASRAIPGCWTI